jgi:hypothetical protein
MDDFEKLRKEIFESKRILHEERLKMTFEQKIDELEETLAWLGDSNYQTKSKVKDKVLAEEAER